MSTTDDEENDVTNYPIETTKPSPSAAAPIETNIQSTIAEVPLVKIISPVDFENNTN